jgi:hypothetical protein
VFEIPQNCYAHDGRGNKREKERHDDSHESQVERRIFFYLAARYASDRDELRSYGCKTQQKQNSEIDIGSRSVFAIEKLKPYNFF